MWKSSRARVDRRHVLVFVFFFLDNGIRVSTPKNKQRKNKHKSTPGTKTLKLVLKADADLEKKNAVGLLTEALISEIEVKRLAKQPTIDARI